MKLSQLEHTNKQILTHEPSRCEGEVCSLHNRTEHSMRSFPQLYRFDREMMERICPHGIGHPDPDDYKIVKQLDLGSHGCCGICCKPYLPEVKY